MRKIFSNAAGQLRVAWRLLIWLVTAVGIQVLIGIVARLLHLANEGAFLDPKRLILGDWVATFVPVVIATLVMMKIERRTLGDYYIPVRGLLGRNFWIGALWGIAAVSLLMGLIALAGGYRIEGVALHEHVAYWALMWLVASASIGIVEEIAFRGYMLRTAGRWHRVLVGGLHPRVPFRRAALFCQATRAMGGLRFDRAAGVVPIVDHCADR